MKKASSVIAAAIFLTIALALPFIADLLPDHTRTLATAPEIVSRAYIDRVVNFVVSGKRADMVFAGSSLVIFPHVLTDGYYENVPVPVPDPIEYADFLARYVDMAHFKKLYASFNPGNSLANRASIVDLGVPSLMLSDCVLLFDKLEKNGALPGEVVLLLAPRDFMDNTVAQERNLLAHELNGRITFREISTASDAGSFVSSVGSAINYGANKWARQFRNCGQRVVLALKKMGKSPRQQVMPAGRTQQEALNHFYFGDGKLADLGVYKKRYNPADHVRIKRELSALAGLIDRLKARRVRITVVSMPLTGENIALIEEDAHKEILQGMQEICASRGVSFVADEQLGAYTRSDFVDSVHLNASGGDKFFKALTRLLSAPENYSKTASHISK